MSRGLLCETRMQRAADGGTSGQIRRMSGALSICNGWAMKSNRLFAFLLFLLFSLSVLATAESVDYKKLGIRTFEIQGKNKLIKIRLDVNIADWRISCNRKTAIVWGQTLSRLKTGVSPYATIYIIDLTKGKSLNFYTTTRGPFDVEFDKNESRAFIDDFIVDAKTGKILSTFNAEDQEAEKERCASFTGQKLE